MKHCPHPDCNIVLGEGVKVCPSCGSPLGAGLERIDDYLLLEMIGETATGVLYRARREQGETEALLRLYSKETTFTADRAERIDQELKTVSALDQERMVQHLELRQSDQGRWYRVSRWAESTFWGDLQASRFFRDPGNRRAWIDLFIEMAEALHILHESGRVMPQMSLHDLILFQGQDERWHIRLDYKLSSGLLPTNRRSVPAAHLANHPDMLAKRPWDKRSDIWTLGRLWLELLMGTDDIEDCRKALDDIHHRFEPIVLHRKLSGLLQAMLENDPDQRATSMAVVLQALRAITDEDIAKWEKFAKDPTRHNKLAATLNWRMGLAAGLILALVLALSFHHRWQTRQDTERLVAEKTQHVLELIQDPLLHVDAAVQEGLSRFLVSLEDMLPDTRMAALAEQYRGSVALVLVAIHLEVQGQRKSVGFSTGTAFLVSSDGYLLTNRHVVAPWLGNKKIRQAFNAARSLGLPIKMDYDLYLWFDGDTAFRRLPGLGSDNPEDIFMLAQAYHSKAPTGQKRVEIAGVKPFPVDLADRLKGLKDDAAVLRVSLVPDGAVPIPLRRFEPGQTIGSGESIFAMGFPYGHASISDIRAVSRQTNGIVTRVFGNEIAINADIHSGNSGGPVIDKDGFAIGIATANFAGQSSMGYVLPVQRVEPLLESIRSGVPQWTGMPLFAVQDDLAAAVGAALTGDHERAGKIMDALLVQAPKPTLYLWAGIMAKQGTRLNAEARKLLERSLAMRPNDASVKFLLYHDDFLTNKPVAQRAFRDDLLALDWRSQHELLGYLTRILEGEVDMRRAVQTGDRPMEWAVLNWIAASLERSRGREAESRRYLLTGANFADLETPLGFMILADAARTGTTSTPDRRYPGATGPLRKADRLAEVMAALLEMIDETGVSEQMPAQDFQPWVQLEAAYDYTAKGLWGRALEAVERYLDLPRRESGSALGMGLLRAQLLALLGNRTMAEEAMNAYIQQIQDPWHQDLARQLLGQISESEMRQKIQGREELLTLATALGLWAEAEDNSRLAIQHYNDALDADLENWPQFHLALKRRNALREDGF